MYIDKRLQALFNEYFEKGKLDDFVAQMKTLIDMAGGFDKPRKHSTYKHDYVTAVKYLEHTQPNEWIQVVTQLGKPYDTWPKEHQMVFQKIIRNIETFDDKRMNGDVKKMQRQKYPFGVQLFKVLLDNGFIRVSENGTFPRYNMIAEFLNSYCKQWDLKETKNHRAQIVRFTEDDIKSYLITLVTAKRSRFTAIAKAFDVKETILAGYEEYVPEKHMKEPA